MEAEGSATTPPPAVNNNTTPLPNDATPTPTPTPTSLPTQRPLDQPRPTIRIGSRNFTVELHEFINEANSSTAIDDPTFLEVETAEGFLDSMPELTFEVTKTFVQTLKKKATRILKLTSKGIQNVRKNGEVSSFYPYENIKNITMKDTNTFVLEYAEAKHSYTYSSPVGMQILQEIKSRMAIRDVTKRQRFTLTMAQKFQQKLIQDIKAEERKMAGHRLLYYRNSTGHLSRIVPRKNGKRVNGPIIARNRSSLVNQDNIKVINNTNIQNSNNHSNTTNGYTKSKNIKVINNTNNQNSNNHNNTTNGYTKSETNNNANNLKAKKDEGKPIKKKKVNTRMTWNSHIA